MFYKLKSGSIINLNQIVYIPHVKGYVGSTNDETYYEVQFSNNIKTNILESDLIEIKKIVMENK